MQNTPFAKQHAEVLADVRSDGKAGLTSEEADRRLIESGPNVIKEKGTVRPLEIFLSQFKSPFVFLLAFAVGLSIYFGDNLDAVAIGAVILINAVIGFIMEYQAGQSMEALKRLTMTSAKVVRDGSVREIQSQHLVVGDLIYLEAGDMVSADARLSALSDLQVNESSLTGESIPVIKQLNAVPVEAPLAERSSMLYNGTYVTKGNGYAVVTATGMQTEIGKIATMVLGAESADTPLEKKISQFSRKLISVTLILVSLIFLAGLLYGNPIVRTLQTSIALAVAAIPEGLPIVSTLALAQGMLRMAKQNVIVKKLAAVETLGGTTVICTDKTGTLTENKIVVAELTTSEGVFAVSSSIDTEEAVKALGSENFEMTQLISALCNTADLVIDGNRVNEIGDPLETGLLKFVTACGRDIALVRRQYPKISEEPFSSETRIMATCHADAGNYLVCAKGAVEDLLQRCDRTIVKEEIVELTDVALERYLDLSERMASSGLRVIGLAYKEERNLPVVLSSELVFVGFVGMIDPSREEVPAAISECKSAGIKVVMVTGDHPATTRNIAGKLGLLNSHDEHVLHGNDMGEYEDLNDARRRLWLSANAFARVSPKQKLDLVTVLQENKEVVAMTGDGVNDAPALKKADIGIAMGLRGTQVAQQVADMVLRDDSFASIVVAIRQGRIIFDNIRKFIVFLLSCNLSELFLIGFTSMFNVDYALFPLQILFINIVTDVLPALALGVTEGNSDVMKQPPRKSYEPIISKGQWVALIVYAVVITVFSIGAVYATHFIVHGVNVPYDRLANNVMFTTLIFCQLFHVFNVTNDKHTSFFKTDIVKNKYVWHALVLCMLTMLAAFSIWPVARALRLEYLSVEDWLVIVAFSLVSAVVIRLLKKVRVVM